MPIVGFASTLFGVEDVAKCTQFFEDLGLPLFEKNERESCFRLDDGSNVVLRKLDDPLVPKSVLTGYGLKETVLGIDSQESFDRMVRDLSQDRKVEVDATGTARFRTDCDIPLGLRVQPRKAVVFAPDPINAAGNINRFNQLRKWKRQARPKTTNHVVYAVENYKKSWEFFERRLGFLLSDRQTGIGYYSHADGMYEHHNLFLADCTLPGMPGKPSFHHINFGVEDIDELMVGANRMQRAGYQPGFLGNGRHRISSALFSYWRIPGGAGEAEYGADTDYIDQNWIPRDWEFRFGTAIWMQTPPDFMAGEAAWDMKFAPEYVPVRRDGDH